jgi:tetratricopeptide (TPR) repeat protein
MKNFIIVCIIALPLAGISQTLSCKEAAKIYTIVLEDFQSSPLLLHEMDRQMLVTKPQSCHTNLPSNIGNSEVSWIHFDDIITGLLNTSKTNNSGRSVILITHNQPSPDSVTVRIDQWTLGDLEKGISLKPINIDIHPEYKNKNHDFTFIRVDSSWELVNKSNDANPQTQEQQEVEATFQKGNKLYQQGKYEEALYFVNESMAIDSSLYQRYMFRARIKVELQMFESAISDVTKCIERCDCSTREVHVPQYYLERAEIHMLNNDFTSALDDINKSISLHPDNWKAYDSRAVLYIQLEEFENALTDLNYSIQLNSKAVRSYYHRGIANLNLGFRNAACEDFQVAINAGYEEPVSWFSDNCK